MENNHLSWDLLLRECTYVTDSKDKYSNKSQQLLRDLESSSALLFLIRSRWWHQAMGDCKPKPDQIPSAIDNIAIKHIKTCQTLPGIQIGLLKPIFVSPNTAVGLGPAAPTLSVLGWVWVKTTRSSLWMEPKPPSMQPSKKAIKGGFWIIIV